MQPAKCLFLVLCFAGCSSYTQMGGLQAQPPKIEQASSTAGAPRDPVNDARLEALWRSRTQVAAPEDYPIAAGDLIEISVPAFPELEHREERISGDGTLALPMLGSVRAAGLTVARLRDELSTRLGKYMYHPQVDLLVKEYRSRQVAVVGAVRLPGLVTLASTSESVLDVITRSGGMNQNAADQIILIPVEQSGEGAAQRIASIGSAAAPAASDDVRPASTDTRAEPIEKQAMDMIPLTAQPVFISLHSTSLSGAGKYLALPVRPGDVIVVPGGGDVMVVGWVQYPGHFSVGSGLTVLGAIGAAGGPMFAADLRDVRLIRTNKDGGKEVMSLDLKKIQHAEELDPPVQANDVIDVPYSGVKIGPYIFYNILTRMGFGLPVPPI